jgi:hypothetical protein
VRAVEAGTPRERSPAATLDQIRAGGAQLVLNVRNRLQEVQEAVDGGRFNDAHNRCAELYSRLATLASAEQSLGGFEDAYAVRAKEVEPGMILRGWGTVLEAVPEVKNVPGDEPHLHVHLKFEDGDDQEVHGDQELIAVRGS